MAVLMVSFRIEEFGDDIARRRSLCAAIESIGTRHWKDTTSFYLLESERDPKNVAKILEEYIDTDRDILLIRSMENKSAVVTGRVVDSDLFELMPYCKQL